MNTVKIDDKRSIINGDTTEILKHFPDESIDLILTDPPYNISKDNNFTSMGRSGIDFGEWDKGFDQFGWIKDAKRVLKKGGSIVQFNSWKNLGPISDYYDSIGGLTAKDIIRWIKNNPMPRNRDRRYISDYEFAIWCTKDGGKWVFNRQDENYERPEFTYPVVNGGANRIHPTQKPVELMEDLIKIHSNENDLILDPFMGSGSTGIACMNLNRRFIGIELDESYFSKSKDRLEHWDAKNNKQ